MKSQGQHSVEINRAVERLRVAVENLAVSLDQTPSSRVVTISAGVAERVPNDARNIERNLEGADRALYEAKKAGRNNVQIAPSG